MQLKTKSGNVLEKLNVDRIKVCWFHIGNQSSTMQMSSIDENRQLKVKKGFLLF